MGWRIREFVRNLLSRGGLEKNLRPGRRRAATSLRLESLEDRTVTSTMGVVQVVLLAPANIPPTQSASLQTATLSSQTQPTSTSDSINAGLDALAMLARVSDYAVVPDYANPGSFSLTLTLSSSTGNTVTFDADQFSTAPNAMTSTSGSVQTSTSGSLQTSTSGSLQTPPANEPVNHLAVSAPGISSTAESAVGSPAHTSGAASAPVTVAAPRYASGGAIVNSFVPQGQAANITDNQVQAARSTANGNLPVADVRSTNGTTVQADALPQSQPASVVNSDAQPARGDGDAGPLNGSLLTADDQPDGSLLRRYVKNQEQAAFTALVQRHERFVLGICRRVLGDSHAAEDAFQATFLVLARRAGAMEWRGPLTGWLYKVAYHLSLRVRAVNARQKLAEKLASAEQLPQPSDNFVNDLEREEVRVVVNEELERMPEKYRLPLVLCFLGGLTHEQAANQMGLPRGSMAKRIAEALKQLRRRLLNRGLSL